MTKISALYVATDGPYFGLDGVDPWDEKRDARNYRGLNPVIAHPPCPRWCRYWEGGPTYTGPKLYKGDDKGCFAHALWAVRTFGGVLEHPEGSQAWPWHGLTRPPRGGGWIKADAFDGWTCCVAQGNYGHRAQKLTWLYAVGTSRPDLIWGEDHRPDRRNCQNLSKRQREETPVDFRNLLISMVNHAQCSDRDTSQVHES